MPESDHQRPSGPWEAFASRYVSQIELLAPKGERDQRADRYISPPRNFNVFFERSIIIFVLPLYFKIKILYIFSCVYLFSDFYGRKYTPDMGELKEMTVESEARWAGRAQGAVAVVVLVVAAQFWPGWQLDSAANKDIATAYNEGYTLAQGPACAALFMAQPDSQAKLAELEAAEGVSKQVNLIPEAYRTLPGQERVDYRLGRACLESIKAPAESAQM
jgi:hypothetical protein